jgi:hypothetical protein
MHANGPARWIVAALPLAGLAAWSAPARAADVVLKDDTHVRGEIVDEKPGYVVVKTDDATKVVSMALVARVDRAEPKPVEAAPADQGTTVKGAFGGRPGDHFGFGVGGAYAPGANPATVFVGAAHWSRGFPVGELRVTGAFFAGKVNGKSLSGGLVLGEYRVFLGDTFGFGLGPVLGYGKFTDTTGVVGVSSTPMVLRFGVIEGSLSFFMVHELNTASVDDAGGYLLLSAMF